MKATQALPAEKQIEAVSKKLMELNPGFDGKVTGKSGKGTPTIENGVVTAVSFATEDVSDVSPVQVFIGLKQLECNGTINGVLSKLSDLTPLGDLPLTVFDCMRTSVEDLSPLNKSERLRRLRVQYTKVTPAQVAALQKALPNCKIEWDDPSKPKVPAFTATIPAEAIAFDGHRYLFVKENVTWDQANANAEAMGGHLATITSKEQDQWARTLLEPYLLKTNDCCWIGAKSVAKASPWLWVTGEPFIPLAWGPDQPNQVGSGGSSEPYYLGYVKLANAIHWNDVGITEKSAKSGTVGFLVEWDDPAKANKPKLAYLDPAFQQWVKATQALPAEQQIEAVSKKLMELNPGFDGKVTGGDGNGTPKIVKGVVTEFGFVTDNVHDIVPVMALTGVKNLSIAGSRGMKGRVADLSPLQGMRLTSFSCGYTQVSDLSPLRGMAIASLYCGTTQVSDLSPLEDCKTLGALNVKKTKVTAASVAALQKALPKCEIDCGRSEQAEDVRACRFRYEVVDGFLRFAQANANEQSALAVGLS